MWTHIYVYIYICTYIYICNTYMCVYVYIYGLYLTPRQVLFPSSQQVRGTSPNHFSMIYIVKYLLLSGEKYLSWGEKEGICWGARVTIGGDFELLVL